MEKTIVYLDESGFALDIPRTHGYSQKGNINSDIFYAWLIQDLLPKLPEGCVIVMDNASFHKRSDMLEAIRNAGHTLLFLPPYSPDLNPIEQKWAHAKAIRRKYRCSIQNLFSYL